MFRRYSWYPRVLKSGAWLPWATPAIRGYPRAIRETRPRGLQLLGVWLEPWRPYGFPTTACLQRLKYNTKHSNIIVFAMFWRHSWYLQRLKYDGKHHNIVVFAMFWRHSWYLQHLKYDGKHYDIVVFAMFWMYSWFLQRLKYDTKHNNTIVFAMFWRYSCASNAMKTKQYRCICSVLEVCIVPSAPQIQCKT